jgi:hypothetical protein
MIFQFLRIRGHSQTTFAKNLDFRILPPRLQPLDLADLPLFISKHNFFIDNNKILTNVSKLYLLGFLPVRNDGSYFSTKNITLDFG